MDQARDSWILVFAAKGLIAILDSFNQTGKAVTFLTIGN